MPTPTKLTLTQRVQRLPNCPGWLYMNVMRVQSDLACANKIVWPEALARQARRDAMSRAAQSINALRRHEKAEGIAI